MASDEIDRSDEKVNNASEGASRPPKQEEPRRSAIDLGIVSKWESFLQGTDYVQKIREVADLYPEERSIFVLYSDLDSFDADLAVYLLDHPDLALLSGKQAIKNLMHQDMRKAEINLRVKGLPRDARVRVVT